MRFNFPQSFILILLAFFVQACNTRINNFSVEEKDGPKERMERDVKMMKDPVLGYVPTDRLLQR